MPFLFSTPTIGVEPFINRVGVEPKSLSPGVALAGNLKKATKLRSDALSSTRAKPLGSELEHEPLLPVLKKTLPVEASTVCEPQTPPPVHPSGTTLKVF